VYGHGGTIAHLGWQRTPFQGRRLILAVVSKHLDRLRASLGADLTHVYDAFDEAEDGTFPESDIPLEHGAILLEALERRGLRLADQQEQPVTRAADAIGALKGYSDAKDLGRDGLTGACQAGFDIAPA
jgi:hypothetical protein